MKLKLGYGDTCLLKEDGHILVYEIHPNNLPDVKEAVRRSNLHEELIEKNKALLGAGAKLLGIATLLFVHCSHESSRVLYKKYYDEIYAVLKNETESQTQGEGLNTKPH